LPVIDVKGQKVAYEDAGAGLPIVFIPGIAESRESYSRQISGLSSKYRVIAYDLRAAVKTGDYTIRLLADDLAHFLHAIRVSTAVICGHSFGGAVAQEFAITYPEDTSALVLISAFATLPSATDERLISWLTPRGGSGGGAFGWLRTMFGHREIEPDSYEWLASQAAGVSRGVVEFRLQAARSYDATERLAAIGVPTLVVVGAKDREDFLKAAQVLYDGIPDCDLEVIEGGDHYCPFLRHDLVNAALDEYISSRMSSIA
jgi:pimeloyl-ACP methyl ester carboxylesterase